MKTRFDLVSDVFESEDGCVGGGCGGLVVRKSRRRRVSRAQSATTFMWVNILSFELIAVV
jgi:hypothetical protein